MSLIQGIYRTISNKNLYKTVNVLCKIAQLYLPTETIMTICNMTILASDDQLHSWFQDIISHNKDNFTLSKSIDSLFCEAVLEGLKYLEKDCKNLANPLEYNQYIRSNINDAIKYIKQTSKTSSKKNNSKNCVIYNSDDISNILNGNIEGTIQFLTHTLKMQHPKKSICKFLVQKKGDKLFQTIRVEFGRQLKKTGNWEAFNHTQIVTLEKNLKQLQDKLNEIIQKNHKTITKKDAEKFSKILANVLENKDRELCLEEIIKEAFSSNIHEINEKIKENLVLSLEIKNTTKENLDVSKEGLAVVKENLELTKNIIEHVIPNKSSPHRISFHLMRNFFLISILIVISFYILVGIGELCISERISLQVGNWYTKGILLPKKEEKFYLLCNKFAKEGSASAQINIAKCYYEGKGVPQNPREAIRWLDSAITQGKNYAKVYKAKYLYDESKYSEVINLLKDSIDESRYHYKGILNTIFGNLEDSYYKKKFEHQRLLLLGASYQNMGITKESLYYYNILANKGNTLGQRELAKIYNKDKIDSSNLAKAISWFSKAADNDDQFSNCFLGDQAFAKNNFQLAEKYYLKAAQKGNTIAKRQLGKLLLKEMPYRPIYKKEGLAYLKEASSENDGEACFELARFYWNQGYNYNIDTVSYWINKTKENNYESKDQDMLPCLLQVAYFRKDYQSVLTYYTRDYSIRNHNVKKSAEYIIKESQDTSLLIQAYSALYEYTKEYIYLEHIFRLLPKNHAKIISDYYYRLSEDSTIIYERYSWNKDYDGDPANSRMKNECLNMNYAPELYIKFAEQAYKANNYILAVKYLERIGEAKIPFDKLNKYFINQLFVNIFTSEEDKEIAHRLALAGYKATFRSGEGFKWIHNIDSLYKFKIPINIYYTNDTERDYAPCNLDLKSIYLQMMDDAYTYKDYNAYIYFVEQVIKRDPNTFSEDSLIFNNIYANIKHKYSKDRKKIYDTAITFFKFTKLNKWLTEAFQHTDCKQITINHLTFITQNDSLFIKLDKHLHFFKFSKKSKRFVSYDKSFKGRIQIE